MPKTVSVAFPLPVRRTFVYSVQDEFEPRASPGSRVRAAVGERLLSGVIVAGDPEIPPGVSLRPLAEALDASPALSEELLLSTRKIADRFFCPWGEILRAALPSRLAPGERASFQLTSAGAAAIAFAQGQDRDILETLLEKGRGVPDAFPGAPGEVRHRLRDLEARGWIRAGGSAARRETRIQAVYSADARDLSRAEAAAGRSKKCLAAFRFLADLGRPATAEELRGGGFGPGLWKRLAAGGAVRVTDQSRRPERDGLLNSAPVTLTAAQETALGRIELALRERKFLGALLFGVTGSGKTEVYLRAIAKALEAGRGAVWLVPEIALTPVFARSLEERFGDEAVVLHSALGEARRSEAWERMRLGSARIVIGPRSAVFAPIPSIGLFVIDEEHDGSYKQEESPRYDARDAAAIRAQANGAVLLLGSATPSVETLHAAREGRITLLTLPERIERRALPAVEIVDLRKEPWLPQEKGTPLFSRPLVDRLREVFSRGEQAILLAPRRGYAPVLLCRKCGNDFRCDSCSVPQVVHRRSQALICHYCGARRGIPVRCESCGGTLLEAVGSGTERAAERFAELFPSIRYAVLDSDTARRKGVAASVLDSMAGGRIQALIGTQMVAKGHHFPRVTAIGVLSADTILNFPDFRASEKTFQMVAQVSGRAGRGDLGGTVHVQTFQPESPALRAAVTHDSAGFVQRELEFRKAFFYPPFSELAEILFSSEDAPRAEDAARSSAGAAAEREGVVVSGPAAAPIERLAGKWRFQVLLRSRSRRAVLAALEAAAPDPAPSGVAVAVDVDPRNLM
ncbi:MAG: replication restart helicase PriA [Thermoanaerobaculia bacterium]